MTATDTMGSRRKRALFRALAICVSLGAALLGAELFLRWRQHTIAGSEHLDAGFIRYDPVLGWRLTPAWTGRHQHYDFDVHYTIKTDGFRFDPAQPKDRRGRLIAVVGDSFTFGLGVEDDQTFVSLLNRDGTNTFVNLSVPGFSTDQQALLIEETLPSLRPDEVWLVVYVGNDLLDNQYSRPLQLNMAKPLFELGPDGPVLRNVPVPRSGQPLRPPPADLAAAVLGDAPQRSSRWERVLDRFALGRLLRDTLVSPEDRSAEFPERFRPAMHLFAALLDRIRQHSGKARAELKILVLAGRSFVEEPGSLSSQYQQFGATEVLAAGRKLSLPSWDLASMLRHEQQTSPRRLYFRHDGHLTFEGHSIVKEWLLERPGASPAEPLRR
ncbi:MAG: hypothetical protein HS113_28010 [Verrucomicrobiales bacterium]|nr:hypothetical protein [Verrucomicrobiales bacterium]